MRGNKYTSARSRTVANELRILRERADLSCEQVGKLIGASASKIGRMETGRSGLQPEDVGTLLGYYRVSAAKRKELLDRLRDGDQLGWWERQTGLPKLWRNLIEYEDKANDIRNYEALVIPGLLQTDEYCRAILRGDNSALSETDLVQLVGSRMSRQALLTRPNPPMLRVVVHEFALRLPIGEPGVMARQMSRLLAVAARPRVDLRVVPISAGANAALRGPFILLDFPDEPSLGFTENQKTGFFLEEQSDLDTYRVAWGDILAAALAPGATIELITALAAELT